MAQRRAARFVLHKQHQVWTKSFTSKLVNAGVAKQDSAPDHAVHNLKQHSKGQQLRVAAPTPGRVTTGVAVSSPAGLNQGSPVSSQKL